MCCALCVHPIPSYPPNSASATTLRGARTAWPTHVMLGMMFASMAFQLLYTSKNYNNIQAICTAPQFFQFPKDPVTPLASVLKMTRACHSRSGLGQGFPRRPFCIRGSLSHNQLLVNRQVSLDGHQIH